MRGGYWTPWILQDRTKELFVCKCVLSFLKTREEWLWSWLREHQSCLRGFKIGSHHLTFNWRDNLCPKWGIPELWGQPLPSKTLGARPPPQWIQNVGHLLQQAWRTEHGAKEDYSPGLRSHQVCLAGFWTSFGPVTSSFFPISPFWNENVSFPPLCFGSTQLVWSHGFAAGEEFYLRMTLTLESHPYLIY